MWKSNAVLVRAVLAAGVTVVAAQGCAGGMLPPDTTGGAGGSTAGKGGAGGGNPSGQGGGGGSNPTGAGGGNPTGQGGGGGSNPTGAGGGNPTGDGGSGGGTVVDAGAGVDAAGLPLGAHILYQCNDTNGGTFSSIGLHFQIANMMPRPIELGTFTIRYWFTSDNVPFTMQSVSCEQIQPQPLMCPMVKPTLHAVDPPRPMADSYIEIAFTEAAGGVGWMGKISQLDIRWQSMRNPGPMQSNDYSYGPTVTTYADYKKVTAYVGGILVWGTEP